MLKMNTLYLPIITSIAQKTGGWWGVRYPPFKGRVIGRVCARRLTLIHFFNMAHFGMGAQFNSHLRHLYQEGQQ